MGRRRLTDYQRKKKKKPGFVPPDPRCYECDYWRYLGGVDDESIYCCHYALYKGKLRDRISETECGSFEPEGTNKYFKIGLDDVPMTQWGVGGLTTQRRGER